MRKKDDYYAQESLLLERVNSTGRIVSPGITILHHG